MVTCIVSGGQTGADQGGLEAGRLLGINTGGYAPKNYRTELGQQRELLQSYGLMEHEDTDYRSRTRDNVRLSDGTVIFGQRSPGSNATEEFCRLQGKPCLWIHNPLPTPRNKLMFHHWIMSQSIHILNVAGNRLSVNPRIQSKVKTFLCIVLHEKTTTAVIQCEADGAYSD